MAIQISGTTVIDNSRNLTSIANATNANTASAFVQRDASGNFSAGTITAALTGNSSTATTFQTARTINGVSFNGSANITVTSATLTTARNINGVSFNGSANIDVNPTSGAFSNGQGAKTIQSGGSATGGSSGDIFYIY